MSANRVLPLAPDYRRLRLDEASRRKGLNTGPGIARRFGASGRAELAPAWQADSAPTHEIHARNLPHEKQSGGRLHIPRPLSAFISKTRHACVAATRRIRIRYHSPRGSTHAPNNAPCQATNTNQPNDWANANRQANPNADAPRHAHKTVLAPGKRHHHRPA